VWVDSHVFQLLLGGVLETSKQQLNVLLQLWLLAGGCGIHGALEDIKTVQHLEQSWSLLHLPE
jgi:hypothetical protein